MDTRHLVEYLNQVITNAQAEIAALNARPLSMTDVNRLEALQVELPALVIQRDEAIASLLQPEKKKSYTKWILLGLGGLAAVAGIAYFLKKK